MKYIYTASDCPNCENLKAFYKERHIPFEERSSDRIKSPQDSIDQEALIQSCLQNVTLPVEIED